VLQPLTDRQEAILEFIRKSIRERGYPPTLREIGSHMNIRSTNGVSDHLRALERKGHLKREDMKSRALVPVPAAASKAIRVSRAPDDEDPSIFDESEREYQLESDAPAANDGLRVPLLGKVAAGALSLATQQIEQQILMDPALLKANPGETFALRVFGDSMIEAGIHEGDLLFVRKQDIAARADVVVALVGDEATVKRYYPEADHIRLQPENKRLKPIYVRRSELSQFKILGVVVGLFRPATGFGVKAGL
jgi:repressor LexA